jgi:hypothetical protein
LNIVALFSFWLVLFKADRELAYILDDEKFLKQESEIDRVFDSDDDFKVSSSNRKNEPERKESNNIQENSKESENSNDPDTDKMNFMSNRSDI